jgi:hypothetical protein
MPLLQSRPPLLHANDRNGLRDVKLKTGLPLREVADTARPASDVMKGAARFE